jgi:hypothetical protein
MQRSFIRPSSAITLMLLAFSVSAKAEERPSSVISEPYDQRPGAITRPMGEPDRKARRGRTSPELVTTPRALPRPADPPRYDRYGQRSNIPGRPDTLDPIGQARRYTPRPPLIQSGPTVRTDAATRINQFPPR